MALMQLLLSPLSPFLFNRDELWDVLWKRTVFFCASPVEAVFCSPWPAIHSLIQSDWLPPDAESTKLDLSDFCFYREHGGRNKRLRGRRQNPLMNWLTSPVIRESKTASAHDFQVEKFTPLNWHHPTPLLWRNFISSRKVARFEWGCVSGPECRCMALEKQEGLRMESKAWQAKSMS